MNSGNKVIGFIVIFLLFSSYSALAQDAKSFRFQVAFGVNSPSKDGFVENFEAKTINFPTINLGLQYMFARKLGIKVDYGYNRINNNDDSPEFKINYTRIDGQLVYDATGILYLPPRMGVFFHAGAGQSMIKPLGDYTANDTSFLNAMGGIEFHLGLTDAVTMYLDASYIKAFSDDFDPVVLGYGSLNGDLTTVTIGFSISLTGCKTCTTSGIKN